MKEQDFYDLKIGQVIYINEEKFTVGSLKCYSGEFITFLYDGYIGKTTTESYWNQVMGQCSLTPSKKKTKYYMWAYNAKGSDTWVRTTKFYNKEFNTTNHACLKSLRDAEEKKCFEDIFIEV